MEPRHLDFKVIAQDLDNLLAALENKLEREAAKIDPMARGYFLTGSRIVRNTWNTILYFCADRPADPLRKREFALSAAPLNRSILDIIFNTVFLLEDADARLQWFVKAGWRDQKIEYERLKADFGHLPDWAEWLGRVYGRMLPIGVDVLGLTAEEANNPRSITAWPNPGGMISYGITKGAELPQTRKLLRRLDELFYSDLSQQAHSSFQGLVKRGSYFTRGEAEESRNEVLERLRYDQMFTSLTLLFLLVSVLDEYFRLGLDARSRYLWTVVADVEDRTRMVYQLRYEAPLFDAAPRPA
jgi:hypothetical protein